MGARKKATIATSRHIAFKQETRLREINIHLQIGNKIVYEKHASPTIFVQCRFFEYVFEDQKKELRSI